MSSKSRARASSSNPAWAIVLLALLLVGTVGLTVAAVAHGQPDATNPELVEGSSPSPTPTPGLVDGSSPTPTPTPTPELVEASPPTLPPLARAQERFLLLDTAGTAWRAVAGSCASGEPPLLERSADGGATWSDVTPRYLGITEISALIPFNPGEAQMVAAVGPECAVQGLRTYTQGTFWAQYPEVLDGVSYLPPTNSAAAVTPIGAPTAPCVEPTSLSVEGDAAALVCDTVPYVWSASSGAGWSEISAAPARAVLLSGETITLVRTTADCSGIAVSTTSVIDPGSLKTECLSDLDPSSAVALANGPEGVVIWSGDTLAVSPREVVNAV